MDRWEVFVSSLDLLPEEQELLLTLRTLNPGSYKYTYKYVRARISQDLQRYPDRLCVRFGRGQPADRVFSIQILQEIPRIPEKYQKFLTVRSNP